MKMIREVVEQAVGALGLPVVAFSVEHPREESHGDYSTNVAMVVGDGSPRELAEKIVSQWLMVNGQWLKIIDKIEVAGPGFINFYLKNEFFLEETQKAMEPGYGKSETLKGKKVMVEYTDPNPFKEMHIGHLMSNTIGESLARLQEACGAEVKRACYQGDVGLHVAKSIWGMQALKMKLNDLQGLALQERQKMMGQAYALGASKYEEDPPVGEAGETAKAEMQSLNKQIYEGLSGRTQGSAPTGLMEMYHEGRKWSLEYFETIYQRLGTKFDEYFFESEAGPVGLEVVIEGLDKGVLEIGEEGAVVYRGEKDGLHTRVFRNKIGLPTYEAKDLGLAKTKWGRYKYDYSYNVTGNEITEYFKVVLKVMEQLYPELRAKTTHIPHGMMKLTTGKMSSRTGKVVTGESLLNELKETVLAKMGTRDIKDPEKIADQVAVAALKYTVLKQAVGGDIVYEPEKMTNLEGDTGPYLQYTYVRAMSVLKKTNTLRVDLSHAQGINPSAQELAILRWIYRYPEEVAEAGEKMAPHLVASYLYELASRFNSFYNAQKIGDDQARLALTCATAKILESGLGLLGIQAPEEM